MGLKFTSLAGLSSVVISASILAFYVVPASPLPIQNLVVEVNNSQPLIAKRDINTTEYDENIVGILLELLDLIDKGVGAFLQLYTRFGYNCINGKRSERKASLCVITIIYHSVVLYKSYIKSSRCNKNYQDSLEEDNANNISIELYEMTPRSTDQVEMERSLTGMEKRCQPPADSDDERSDMQKIIDCICTCITFIPTCIKMWGRDIDWKEMTIKILDGKWSMHFWFPAENELRGIAELATCKFNFALFVVNYMVISTIVLAICSKGKAEK